MCDGHAGVVLFVGCGGSRGNRDSFVVHEAGDVEADQGIHVEDQTDAAIAEHGAARERGVLLQGAAETLDDDFLFADKFVHHQAARLIARFHDDHDGVGGIGDFGGLIEILVQPQQRTEPAADVHHFAALVHGGDHLGPGAERFAHRQGRDDVTLFADADDHAVNDGERERQIDGEGRALAGDGINLHFAAQFLDVPADYIHADAAPGDVCDLIGGGETGGEDEFVNLLVRQRLVGFDDAFLLRLGEEFLFGEPVAVVLNLDDDVATAMEGAEMNGAEAGLAFGGAGLGFFDAVIGGVADHVHKRIGDFFDDVAIQFGVFTAEDKLHEFVLLGGEIAHEAGHLLERGADRDHAQRHGGALQFTGDAAQLAEIARQIAAGRAQQFRVLHHHGFGDHQFADQINERVELDRIHLHITGGVAHGAGIILGRFCDWGRQFGEPMATLAAW
jgi:hypothetical protein